MSDSNKAWGPRTSQTHLSGWKQDLDHLPEISKVSQLGLPREGKSLRSETPKKGNEKGISERKPMVLDCMIKISERDFQETVELRYSPEN